MTPKIEKVETTNSFGQRFWCSVRSFKDSLIFINHWVETNEKNIWIPWLFQAWNPNIKFHDFSWPCESSEKVSAHLIVWEEPVTLSSEKVVVPNAKHSQDDGDLKAVRRLLAFRIPCNYSLSVSHKVGDARRTANSLGVKIWGSGTTQAAKHQTVTF